MKIRHRYPLIGALIAMSAVWSPLALSDIDGPKEMERQNSPSHFFHHRATGLVGEVREGTRRFRDVVAATAEGYGLFLGCVSSHQEGAMGVHYVNGGLVGNPTLDPRRPEALVYEPTRNGKLRLVAVEFVVLAEAWDAANPAPPTLLGQSFHYSGSPNRFGLPAFYALHVWAWKRNPHGMFVNFNPRVSCEQYDPE